MGIYFLTRWASLDALPIFLDESVHLEWADRLYREGRILKPVGEGRLLAVAAYGVAQLFEDRLHAARAVASLAGAITLVFTSLLAGRMFGPLASVIAGSLYILSPFALVYDRLALSDGFLAAAIAGLMFATYRLSEAPHDSSIRVLTIGLIFLAILSKVSAALFLLTLPLGAALLGRERSAAFRSALIALGLGLLISSPMLWFFWTNGREIGEQHIVSPLGGGEWAGSVLRVTVRDMSDWVMAYFTPATMAGAVVSLGILRERRAVWLVMSILLPFGLFALFSEPWSARYVLPTLPPLLLLLAGGTAAAVSKLAGGPKTVLAAALTLLASVQALRFDAALLLDPATAPFPRDDRIQLVSGWPAGYGIAELARDLKTEGAKGPVDVLVDTGGLRTFPSGLAILIGTKSGVRRIEGDFASEEVHAAARARTGRFFLITGPRPDGFAFKERWSDVSPERVRVFERPGGEWAASLFVVNGSRERMSR